jgi:DDE_Tnp_1-associated
MERFRACFANLADPRTGNAQRHDLLEVLLIALCATLSGAETCVDMALFGEARAPLLRRFMRLPGGIPSHDTFSRLFRLLDPKAFEACFGRFVAAFAARVEEVVAIDGKAARRSFDRRAGARPLHLVSAPPAPFGAGCCAVGSAAGRWACEQRLVLGQCRVDGHSNEITALPELLALLALDGGTVTADAMHCQKATAQAILDRGGDDVRALKTNQPTLLDDARLLLDDPAAPKDDIAETVDGDHGRIETRLAEIVHDVALAGQSTGAAAQTDHPPAGG